MMIRKFYDIELGCVGSDNYVIDTENREEKVIIECECGTHLLQVQSDADIYTNSNGTMQVHQTFYLAMFNYGNQKDRLWRRIRIAWKYLRTGKMFSDQICLTPDEAKRAAVFIDGNIIKTEK